MVTPSSIGLSFLTLEPWGGIPIFDFNTFAGSDSRAEKENYLSVDTSPTNTNRPEFPPVQSRPANLLVYEKSLVDKVPIQGLEYEKTRITFKLKEKDFNSRVRFILKINNKYIGETYGGKPYYMSNSINNGIASITKIGIDLKKGDQITINVFTHKPGERGTLLSSHFEYVKN